MAKTTNLYARIEPDLKEQAEQILNALGLSPSSAITMFYKQVVLQQGLPFDVKLNYKKTLNITAMTKEEIDIELEKGYQDALARRTKSVDEVFETLHKGYYVIIMTVVKSLIKSRVFVLLQNIKTLKKSNLCVV